jgi:hypothetical protein
MRTLIPALACLAGCVPYVNSNFVPTNNSGGPVQPVPAEAVTIVSTAPQRPFVELGFVDGETYDVGGEAPELALMAMRREAGRHGCDALLVTGTNDFARGIQVSSTTGAGYHAACLAYTDKDPARPGPVPLAPPPAPPTPHGLLFRDAEGNVYRVAPDARAAALHAGWTPIGAD